MLVVFQGS